MLRDCLSALNVGECLVPWPRAFRALYTAKVHRVGILGEIALGHAARNVGLVRAPVCCAFGGCQSPRIVDEFPIA